MNFRIKVVDYVQWSCLYGGPRLSIPMGKAGATTCVVEFFGDLKRKTPDLVWQDLSRVLKEIDGARLYDNSAECNLFFAS